MKLLLTVRHIKHNPPGVSGDTWRSFNGAPMIRCAVAQTKGAAIRWRLLVFAILYRMTS
ncbi:MAG TPA: hypothetical protein VFW30_12115 [Bryocella sp.]|nr:hypothetical protein [Bryocella sp.]